MSRSSTRRKLEAQSWNNIVVREGQQADLAPFPIRASHGSRAVDGATKEAGGAKMTVRRQGQITRVLTQKKITWQNFEA